MKKILYFLFLLFAVVGCNDSEDYIYQTPEKAFDSDIQNKNYSGNISHPFFEVDYVQNELGINLNRVVSSSKVYDVMNEMSKLDFIDKLTTEFESQNSFPCWSCAETDYQEAGGVSIVLTPFINLQNGEITSLLIYADTGTEISLKHLDVKILNYMYHSTERGTESESRSFENYQYYWRFVDYFTQLKNNTNPNVNDYVIFKDKGGCVRDSATDWCVCSGSGAICDCEEKDQCGSKEDEIIDAGDSTNGGPSPFPPIWPVFDWGTIDFGNDPFPGSSTSSGTTSGGTSYEIKYGIPAPPNHLTGLFLIGELIDYINDNTNIVLTSAELATLTDLTNFDLIIWPLITSLSQMTEIALDNFINFATDHTEFLNSQTPAESLYLIDNSEFTNTLGSWLNNHNDELGRELGQFM